VPGADGKASLGRLRWRREGRSANRPSLLLVARSLSEEHQAAHCPRMLLAVLPLLAGAGLLPSHVRLPATVLFSMDDGPLFLLNVRFPPITFGAATPMANASPSASLDWIVRFPVIVEPSMKLPSVSLLTETFPLIVEPCRSANRQPLHV